jgi:hypothetical protein
MQAHIEWIWWLFFLFLCGYLVWTWTTWFKSSDKANPRWRAIALAAGLFFATVSTVLDAFLFIHAAVTGGYRFYHPVELFCIRARGLTALLGLVAALTGRGRVRCDLDSESPIVVHGCGRAGRIWHNEWRTGKEVVK